jgi:Mrp family chromosome partitioning ATPase
MSKNFELMKNLGKERDMFHTSIDPLFAAAAPATVAARIAEPKPPVDLMKPLALKMEDQQRDEIFKLVQRVFFAPGNDGSRLVVVSATESGNGCSWICARMGEVLASQTSGTVCLVDANLRSPGLHKEFAVPNHYGLSDALQAYQPVRGFVTQLCRSNLWLLSCGSATEKSQTLLSSERMRSLLPELQREFDFVLVDAPPIRAGDDTIGLSRNAQGVVLVLRANSSRRETARQAVHDLAAANVRLLGAVLNHRTFPVPESIYKKL